MRNQCLDKAILRPEDKGNCATYVNTLVEQISFLSENTLTMISYCIWRMWRSRHANEHDLFTTATVSNPALYSWVWATYQLSIDFVCQLKVAAIRGVRTARSIFLDYAFSFYWGKLLNYFLLYTFEALTEHTAQYMIRVGPTNGRGPWLSASAVGPRGCLVERRS